MRKTLSPRLSVKAFRYGNMPRQYDITVLPTGERMIRFGHWRVYVALVDQFERVWSNERKKLEEGNGNPGRVQEG